MTLRLMLLGCVVALACTANAQLSGTLTVNSAGGGNYTDIGAAFDDLETQGVSGPVTLLVSGGPYTSNSSYELGADNGTNSPVTGLSATNTLTIRAAGTSLVQINGQFSSTYFGSVASSGAISILVPFTRLEGFSFSGQTDQAILVSDNGTSVANNVTIARCQISGITAGGGIWAGAFPGSLNNFRVENCMIWDCVTGLGAFNTQGLITVFAPGANCSIESCTLVQSNGQENTGMFVSRAGIIGSINGAAIASLQNNILVQTANGTGGSLIFPAGLSPTLADFNVYFNNSTTAFHSQAGTFPNHAAWVTSGRDTNGQNTDPLLTSLTTPLDLSLTSTSPAIDAGSTSVADDIEGDSRPQGSAADVGADEVIVNGPEMDVLRGATPIADGLVSDGLGNIGITATQSVTYTIENNGNMNLALTGTPVVVVTSGTNTQNVTVLAQPASPVTASGSVQFTVNYVVQAAGAFDFTISIANDDSNENPYNWTVSGTGVAAPEINVQRGSNTVLSSGTDAVGNLTFNKNSNLNYTVQNLGTATLNITSITIIGQLNCTATVTSGLTSVAVASNDTFTIQVNPTAAGAFSFDVTIVNDDADENPYTFTVSGTGVKKKKSSGGGDEGCSTNTNGFAWLGMLAALSVVVVGVRSRRARA